MKTLLIGDFSSFSAEQVTRLIQRVENSTVTAIDLSNNPNAMLPWRSVSVDSLDGELAAAEEVLIAISDSDKTTQFIEEAQDKLMAANAQVISFEDANETRQNAEIDSLKKAVETLTSQVASLAEELSNVKMTNTAILGCLPEEQRQQIEAAVSHMQSTVSRTMGLVREFITYLSTLTQPISIESAVNEFSEKLGAGEQFSEMVLGTLENIVETDDYSAYISQPRNPSEVAQDSSLSKAMLAAYSSIVSSLNA